MLLDQAAHGTDAYIHVMYTPFLPAGINSRETRWSMPYFIAPRAAIDSLSS